MPDQDGNVANEHARRLHTEPTTTGTDGAKKPYVRKKLPREEQIADIRNRRAAAARIPDEQRYRPKWMIALELLDELTDWDLQPPVLTADAGYGQVLRNRVIRPRSFRRHVRRVLRCDPATAAAPAWDVVHRTDRDGAVGAIGAAAGLAVPVGRR